LWPSLVDIRSSGIPLCVPLPKAMPDESFSIHSLLREWLGRVFKIKK
jgi:hypothetical protein